MQENFTQLVGLFVVLERTVEHLSDIVIMEVNASILRLASGAELPP